MGLEDLLTGGHMKGLTYKQQKWTLTACLIAALGFNISANKHEYGLASIEFASTSDDVAEGKITTINGVAKVKYVKLEEGKTLAYVTEGSVCESCGKQFTLSTSFNKNDIDQLNVALLKYVSTDKSDKEKPVAKDSRDRSEDKEKNSEMTDEVTERVLAAIEKACNKKDDTQARLECMSDKFVAAISNKKTELSESKLLAFYKENIERSVQKQMSDSRRAVSRMRRAAVIGSSQFANSLEESASPSEVRESALKVIEQVLAGTPKKYESIRKRLVNYETALLKEEALDAQNTFVASRQATGAESVMLMNEAFLKREDLRNLANGLIDANQYAFDKASRYNNLDSDRADTYYNSFRSYAKQVIEGLAINPYNFQVPGNGGLSGGLEGSQNQNGRIGNGGTITGGPGTNVSGRLNGNNIAARATNIQIQPGVNNGVVFGEQQTVTEEMRRMREAVRFQYSVRQ